MNFSTRTMLKRKDRTVRAARRAIHVTAHECTPKYNYGVHVGQQLSLPVCNNGGHNRQNSTPASQNTSQNTPNSPKFYYVILICIPYGGPEEGVDHQTGQMGHPGTPVFHVRDFEG